MQRVRQLENCLEKMAIKFTEAENVHSTYLQIQEHLHQVGLKKGSFSLTHTQKHVMLKLKFLHGLPMCSQNLWFYSQNLSLSLSLQEVREMPHVLAKLQSTVISGQSELSKVAQLSQAAVAAVESTKVGSHFSRWAHLN